MEDSKYKGSILEMRESNLIHAYNLGGVAFMDGKSSSDAPNTRTMEQRESWMRGWWDAWEENNGLAI